MSDATDGIMHVLNRVAGSNPTIIQGANAEQLAAIVPQEFVVADLENILAQYREAPRRTTHLFETGAANSFLEYVSRFATIDSSSYSSRRLRNVRCYIDHHSKSTPGWMDHEASLILRFSGAYERWLGHLDKQLTQADLADFLEDNRADIASPSAPDMLALIGDFRLTKKGSFRQAQNLKNGSVSLEYINTVRGVSSVEVPDELTIRVPVFEFEDPEPLVLRFRYRENEGELRFVLSQARQDATIDAAFERVMERITPVIPGYWYDK